MRLHSVFRKAAFALVCLGSASFYVALILPAFRAARVAANATERSLERAIQLQANNAEYHDRLARLLMYDGDGTASAISHYQAAVDLNPYAAKYWLDLADAYMVTGNPSEQQRSLERALLFDPTTPDVAWEAANFFLLRGDRDKALHNFATVLANDPQRVTRALELCWNASGDADELLDKSIPKNPDSYLSFLRLLMRQSNVQAAERVWNRLVALDQPFPAKTAFPYLDFLLENKEVAAAHNAWLQLPRIDRGLAPYMPSESNLIVNGGFEEKILDGGFDWIYRPMAHVDLALDASEFHSGARSLSVTFDGQNPVNSGISQIIPVKPNTEYAFSAAYRTEEIMSASGPRFSIVDPYTNKSYVLTDDCLGTSPWRVQEAQFRTDAETNLLLLSISRQPPGPLIKGKMWIDDVKLVETQATRGE
jgi:tetratricopeptide (TPR) repeat protein